MGPDWSLAYSRTRFRRARCSRWRAAFNRIPSTVATAVTERCSHTTRRNTSASGSPRAARAARTRRWSTPSTTGSPAAGSGRTERRRSCNWLRPGGAAPLVADHPIGDAVHPQQGLLAVGHVADAAPHGEQRVGHHVVDHIGGHPPSAVVPDRSMTPRYSWANRASSSKQATSTVPLPALTTSQCSATAERDGETSRISRRPRCAPPLRPHVATTEVVHLPDAHPPRARHSSRQAGHPGALSSAGCPVGRGDVDKARPFTRAFGSS